MNADDPWLAHLPLLHRILAGGAPAAAYPALPRSDDIFEHCAYWEPLYYLLASILGWSDLGKGLAWWFANDKADHGDPRLTLMREIWDTEGQIDFFAAWAFQEGREEFSLDAPSSTSAFSDTDWWRNFRSRGSPYRYDPFHGGTNALHLGHSHFCFGTDVDVPPAALHRDPATRQAVLITGDFLTWREELATAGRQLPPLPNQRSWHVDVFDKRVGWLGTYRRSRVTGRWFAGAHSLHMTGQ